MNLLPKLAPWRDTQIKISGPATYALQDIFFNDFLFASEQELSTNQIQSYFPKLSPIGTENLQILQSGPNLDTNNIYQVYTKAISESKKYVLIQTPYFVIDKAMQNALLNALKKGVKIVIIIPKTPDKKLVYGATLLALGKLIKSGAKVYLFNGFIHSKMFVTESMASVGTCNFDNRSFFYNFENTCLCYSSKTIFKCVSIFKDDLNNSTPLLPAHYKKLKGRNVFKLLTCKIISKLV